MKIYLQNMINSFIKKMKIHACLCFKIKQKIKKIKLMYTYKSFKCVFFIIDLTLNS